ncbi:MAG: ATP-dependent helicase HrpB [Sinobacteraceae bacterium]|nr:ATP-dependent helicase HrpB [Nevskiaceae bacterium]
MIASGLPIDEALPALCAALLEHAGVVLQAPPGAGKSTVVPLALAAQPWAQGRRLLVLEPRRLAARAVAQRMAQTLGEPVGATVGYRMRLETRVGPRTRIEVITEGVFTRMLQTDPALEGIAAVVFDEFHERSLQADLGLTLCLDARVQLGSDLRLVVMSATLDAEPAAVLLGDVPRVTAAGRAWPVETRYLGTGLPLLPGGADSPELAAALAVRRALRETEGDLLVFLPGVAEIHRVQARLADVPARVLPLYGELPAAAQDAALESDPQGPRRVILATNVAETSLTIPGIRVVIDTGLVRRAVFDPVTGMSRLETQRISRASAEQRQGRAGRVAAGVCYRLWSEGAQRSLAPFTPPEILDADLAPLALELAGWGAHDAAALRWLDPPPPATLAGARELLGRLGALDVAGRMTSHGRELVRIPAHPRLAHLLVEARRRGLATLGAELAALLSDRDLLRGGGGAAAASGGRAPQRDADLQTRLDLLRGEMVGGVVADRGGLARARRAVEMFGRHAADESGADASPRRKGAAVAAAHGGRGTTDDVGLLLACAYPDRIGRLRTGASGRFALSNGRGAAFAQVERLSRSEFIVAVELDDRDREARILLAAALTRAALEDAAGARIQTVDEVQWSVRDAAVVARRVERLDSLLLAERPLQPPPREAAHAAMLEGLRGLGLEVLPWDEATRTLCARVEMARTRQLPGTADWPAFDAATLLAQLDDWLGPWLDGLTRRAQLARLPLGDALQARLGYQRQRQLDAWLPTHLTVPTGSRIRIDYLDDLAPCAAMRMQEVFGLAETPRLANGTLPVTFKLLSPAQRPLQVTRDLASFWRNGYIEVRKDMRGRYPKHYWPEDPLAAEPRRGVRRPS